MSVGSRAPGETAAASRTLRDPRVVAAALAVLVRAVVALQSFARGAAVPSLDAVYYLTWAREIAGGDLVGRGGQIAGEAFLFNPLYAYAIAPLVAVFGEAVAPIAVVQTLLSAATAALAAAAARRLAGSVAAWTAGPAVAFSTALVHLDGKVAVSGLAAFLVAGAVWALSPEEDGATPRRGHGPFAAGLWLGLAALARPVVLPAVVCAAWLHARRAPGRRGGAAALVLVPFAACAALSFARNLAVSGEPVVFTAANGQNVHLGNNPTARRLRAMATDEFRFGPTVMHEEALFRVGHELGRRPTRSEISSWFTRRAIEDFAAAPAASLVWYATKLRWFATPAELGSSAEIAIDRARVPLLALAFVPTWLLVALAAAAPVVARRRADALLGPGALVLAHALACTLVHPLSHYRSPAVPALAVLAGVAVADGLAAWRASRRGRLFAAAGVAAGVAALGAMPPQPIHLPQLELTEQAKEALARDDLRSAEELARSALAEDPTDPEPVIVLLTAANRDGRPADAHEIASRLVALRPWDPIARLDLAATKDRLGHHDEARREADEVVRRFAWSERVRATRARLLGD